jgi:hypothetical protein
VGGNDLNLWQFLILAAVGLLAGLTGGMLGIGGSIVMIPAMAEILPPDQHLFQAAAMIVNFFVVVPAVVRHRRAGAIDGRTVARIVPPALVGVIAGVLMSEAGVFSGRGEAYLRGLFGLFLMVVSVIELWRLVRGAGEDQPGRTTVGTGWLRAGLIAVPVGIVAGLLGVGGGIVAVPLQRRFLGIPIRAAIANSAAMIIATSLVGACAKNGAYAMEHGFSAHPFILAAVLIPTAVVGSLIGSRLTHRLPVRILKAAFLGVMVLASIRLLSGAVAAKPWTDTAVTRSPAQQLRLASGSSPSSPWPPAPAINFETIPRR